MRKVLIPVLILVILAVGGFFAYQFWWKKDPAPAEDKPKPLSVGANTDSFNQSFADLLTAYNALKDALVASDSTEASKTASKLVIAADSLKTGEIHGDSTGTIKSTAKDYATTIANSGKAVALEKDLDGKRKEFETIADAMFNLIRVVKYNGKKVYWEYCPMAFNKKGAYWMSEDPAIKNPYMGKDMGECGSVEDSLDFTKKTVDSVK